MKELPKYNPSIKVGDPFSFYLVLCSSNGCSDPGFTEQAMFYKRVPEVVEKLTSFKEGDKLLLHWKPCK